MSDNKTPQRCLATDKQTTVDGSTNAASAQNAFLGTQKYLTYTDVDETTAAAARFLEYVDKNQSSSSIYGSSDATNEEALSCPQYKGPHMFPKVITTIVTDIVLTHY
jgi:hypothetical protein